MQGIIAVIARCIRAAERAYMRKWSFLAFFAVAFFGSVFVLAELDLLPEKQRAGESTRVAVTRSALDTPETVAPIVIEAPVKIEIPAIKLSTLIKNPTATDVETLDQELLKGAVRYPAGALLGENGNVVLFGHSSYLPVVKNQAYKTFNEIQRLISGDVIIVYSDTMAYTYEVKSVSKENAQGNAAIPLSVGGKVLTLVTCNSFGAKEDRFVVIADLVESRPLGA